MVRINSAFIEKLRSYGSFDINACYNCGNCTAICPLSTENNSFPRRMIRAAILGLEERIDSSVDPWLCYYCGECTDTCPRDADPGGLMMALRRYQIRKFSVGKIGDFFYKSFHSFFVWLILTLIGVAGIFYFKGNPDMEEIKPLSLFSLDLLHYAGIIAFVFLLVIVFSQLYIMLKSTNFKSESSNKSGNYFKTFFTVLFREVFFQERFEKCEDKSRYFAHLLLVWGFIGLFIATITIMMMDFFAPHSEGIRIIPKILGLISGLPALYGTLYFMIIRAKKKGSYAKFSHHTDWMFILLVFLAILSGFALDILRWSSLFKVYYFTFAFHILVVFELIVSFPFTKFAHILYRPFALFLVELRNSRK